MAHVAAWKKEIVSDLKTIMTENPVVAIVNVHGIPGPQIQKMRADLRGTAKFLMTRNKLIRIALDEAAKEKDGLDGLKEMVDGQCAVVATGMNPFKLFNQMEGTKASAAAKPGDIAPDDIVAKAGPTSFPPGPIVGELQKVGIPAAIDGGKIVIKKDKKLVEKGEPIPEEIAKILPRLDIMPMTVGLDLLAAFEDGIVYDRKVLDIPPDYYPSMLASAASNALSLGVGIVYPTAKTMPILISKAYREAINLAVEATIPIGNSIKILLTKADSHMLALASKIPEFADEKLSARLCAVPPAPKEPKDKDEDEEPKDEEDEEEEVSEEEAAAGLSALFG
ncbi:MAG TPA: 50S ribosomal protein L10 [Methanomassiliicoccales archaeon]|nr:50S ribosomal protein L10 [Methanomassiliicoccales archaeon]